MVEQGYRSVNDSITRMFTRVLERDPGADLGDVLHTAFAKYSSLRHKVGHRPQKRQHKGLHLFSLKIWPVLVYALLGIPPGSNPSNLTQLIVERAQAGKKIWELAGRAVFDMGEALVMNFGGDLDHDQAGTMRFLAENVPPSLTHCAWDLSPSAGGPCYS